MCTATFQVQIGFSQVQSWQHSPHSSLSKQAHTKIKSKWIKDLNKIPETIKFLEKNRGKFLDISLGNDFLDLAPKAQDNQSKNKQMGLHQAKNFSHNKENHLQSEKATYKVG